jgi:tRNA1Val (adenine37-N6)-methyltransferase
MCGLLEVAKKLLRPSGRLYLLYPVLRLEEFFENLNRVGLKSQRIVFIHPFMDRDATHFLLEAVNAPTRELKAGPPLIVYRDPRHYSSEVEHWVGKKYRR